MKHNIKLFLRQCCAAFDQWAHQRPHARNAREVGGGLNKIRKHQLRRRAPQYLFSLQESAYKLRPHKTSTTSNQDFHCFSSLRIDYSTRSTWYINIRDCCQILQSIAGPSKQRDEYRASMSILSCAPLCLAQQQSKSRLPLLLPFKTTGPEVLYPPYIPPQRPTLRRPARSPARVDEGSSMPCFDRAFSLDSHCTEPGGPPSSVRRIKCECLSENAHLEAARLTAFPLPVKFCRKLRFSRGPLEQHRTSCVGNCPRRRAANRCIRVIELRRIEDVEAFQVQLQSPGAIRA